MRKTLEKDFPGELKQPFPAKRWFGSNVEPKFLKSRLDNLSRWFSEVIENESLRSHQALLGFLCLPSQHAGMNLGEAAWRTKLQLTSPLHRKALTTEEVLDNLTSEPKVEDKVEITQENESPASLLLQNQQQEIMQRQRLQQQQQQQQQLELQQQAADQSAPRGEVPQKEVGSITTMYSCLIPAYESVTTKAEPMQIHYPQEHNGAAAKPVQ